VKLAKRKIGLALGSGAARGLAHIGVLEVLEETGVPISMVAGTSAGAAVGALYAQGKEVSLIKKTVLELSRKRLVPLLDLTLPKAGFIRGRKVQDWLRSIIGGEIEFSDLMMPFACVATDITTGEEVVINQGSVVEAIRASISIPAIFTPVKWRDRYLVDGMLVNPVPVNVLKRMGADFIIAVNVIPDISQRAQWAGKKGVEGIKAPGLIGVIMQSIYISTYSLVRSCLEEADIVIQPEVARIGYGDFHRAQECIRQGELAARESIPEVKKRLKI